jgi:hypothetical protein
LSFKNLLNQFYLHGIKNGLIFNELESMHSSTLQVLLSNSLSHPFVKLSIALLWFPIHDWKKLLNLNHKLIPENTWEIIRTWYQLFCYHQNQLRCNLWANNLPLFDDDKPIDDGDKIMMK